MPDWLRDLGEPEAPPAAHVEQPDADDLPGWLRADVERAADSGADATAADVPDWLRDLETEAGATPDTSGRHAPAEADHAAHVEDVQDATPDWLRDLDADTHAPVPPASEATPEWPSPAEHGAEAQSDTPAWLQSDEHGDAAPASSGPADAVEEESGVPGWLEQAPLDEVREVMANDQEISPDIAPFSFEGQTDSGSATPPSDAPAWLQSPSDETEERTTSSWLDALTSPPSPAPEPDDAALDVPSWLQDVNTTEGAEAEPFESLAPGSTAPYDMPAWLRADEQEAEGAEAGEAPAWLQSEQRVESADETPPWPQEETQQTPPGGDVPAWLQAGGRAETPGGDMPAWLPPEEHEHDTTPGEVPEWLQATGAAPPPAETPGEVPEWLHADETDTAEAAQEAAPAAEDVPAWLQHADVAPGDVMAPGDQVDHVPEWLASESAGAADTQPEPAADDHVPEWLRADAAGDTQQHDDVPPWLRDDSGAPLPTSGAPGEAQLPAWLKDAPVDVPPPAGEAEPAAAAPVSDASTWFNDIEAAPIEEPAAEEPESEFLGGTELPAWLSPSAAQREQPSEAAQREARELDWLQRLGGIEEEAPSTVPDDAGPPLTPPTAPVRSQAHLQAVALLERLAAQPTEELASLPETAPAARRRSGAERLLYLALLLVVLAGLLVPALSASLNVPPVAMSARPLFNVLNTLNENDVVLVGYEWNARRISELRPLEQAVIGQLLAKKVKLVIVSTDPQGTLVAFNLRGALAQAGYESRGLDYLWLGYKPGGEVALRSLAQDLPGALRSDFYGDDANISPLAQGFRTNKPLTSLDAFSAVLVLADEPLDVQSWMEQIHRSVPQKPIAFLLPAETAPITQPYMRQANVYYLAGKSGALAYEELRGTPAADGSIQMQYGQQRLGLLVFAALLLISMVIGAASAATRRRRNAS